MSCGYGSCAVVGELDLLEAGVELLDVADLRDRALQFKEFDEARRVAGLPTRRAAPRPGGAADEGAGAPCCESGGERHECCTVHQIM